MYQQHPVQLFDLLAPWLALGTVQVAAADACYK